MDIFKMSKNEKGQKTFEKNMFLLHKLKLSICNQKNNFYNETIIFYKKDLGIFSM